MAKSKEALPKEGGSERASRVLRNINIVGAVALGGVGIAFNAGILTALGAVNAGQAGFFEATRRWAKKRKIKKNKPPES
jgi:predicted transcriptional regulator